MKLFFSSLILFACQLALAAPEPLIVDKSVKTYRSESQIESAHRLVPHSLSVTKFQEVALNAMLTTSGMAWYLEEMSDGFIRARFDYKGDVVIVDVEFDKEHFQVKYVDGYNKFSCKKNIAGICYSSHRHYYSYVSRLVKNIELGIKG